MILALLTTMNSKVKVQVVDGSKCVLECSHDKEESGAKSSDRLWVVWGPVWPSEQNKQGWDRSTGRRQRRPNIEEEKKKKGCGAAWRSTMA